MSSNAKANNTAFLWTVISRMDANDLEVTKDVKNISYMECTLCNSNLGRYQPKRAIAHLLKRCFPQNEDNKRKLIGVKADLKRIEDENIRAKKLNDANFSGTIYESTPRIR